MPSPDPTTATGDPDADDFARMLGMITGFWVSQVVAAYANLAIPEELQSGPATALKIAKGIGANERATARLLDAGVTLGLLVKDGEQFAALPLLRTLAEDSPNSLRHVAQVQAAAGHWLTWGKFTEAVRTGQSQSAAALGMSIFDYFGKTPEEAALFSESMSDLSSPIIEESVKYLAVEAGEVIVDVGGANGAFVLALLAANPSAGGVLLDLPHVTPGAESEARQRGLHQQFTAVAGDFFVEVPKGDLYLLKYILHDWDDDSCVKILRRCREAMNQGGRLAIVDITLGDADPGIGALMDLNMLAMTTGAERQISDVDRILEAAGLRRVQVDQLQAPYTIIHAQAA
jgi:hypothetical protein